MPISVLLATALISVLIMSVLVPAYALESCASNNGNICVKWFFLDNTGAQINEPTPILIDTTHTHETTIKWYVVDETGSGEFQFKTIPHVSKGTPGMIKNCATFPIEMFNGSTSVKRQYECTIKADDNMGLGTLEIDLAVNDGKSLPYYDTSNHFVGTSYQHSTDIVVGPNAVPEFGQISILVLIISVVSVILISAKTKHNFHNFH